MVLRAPIRSVLTALLVGSVATGVSAGAATTDDTALREQTQTILAQPEITLVDLFRLAELTSPTLAAARSGVAASAGRARQAGLYPNPTLELELEDISTDDPGDRAEIVALELPIIWSGRRGDAVAAARAEHRAAARSFVETRREVMRRVHQTWAELLHCREAEAALDQLLVVGRETLRIAQIRFDARAVPESHVTRALLEVYELEAKRQHLTAKEVRATARLRGLLGVTQIDPGRLVGALNVDIDNLPPEAIDAQRIAEHPALVAARLRVEAAAATLDEARAARLPDLHLTGGYGRSRASDERFYKGGLALSLPLFDRNQGRIDEGRATLAQARDAVRVAEGELTTAWADARQHYIATRDQLSALRDRIMPAAERGITQAQAGYRAGRLSFLELIDAQGTLATVRLRNLELTRDLVFAAADWMSLVGDGPYAHPPAVHQAGDER